MQASCIVRLIRGAMAPETRQLAETTPVTSAQPNCWIDRILTTSIQNFDDEAIWKSDRENSPRYLDLSSLVLTQPPPPPHLWSLLSCPKGILKPKRLRASTWNCDVSTQCFTKVKLALWFKAAIDRLSISIRGGGVEVKINRLKSSFLKVERPVSDFSLYVVWRGSSKVVKALCLQTGRSRVRFPIKWFFF
jgi:hypothetical protein